MHLDGIFLTTAVCHSAKQERYMVCEIITCMSNLGSCQITLRIGSGQTIEGGEGVTVLSSEHLIALDISN